MHPFRIEPGSAFQMKSGPLLGHARMESLIDEVRLEEKAIPIEGQEGLEIFHRDLWRCAPDMGIGCPPSVAIQLPASSRGRSGGG